MSLVSRSGIVALAALCGIVANTAFAQRGGGLFGAGSNLVTIATNEAVQKDAGISGDAVGKLTTLRDEYREAAQKAREDANINFQGFQDLSDEERTKLMEKFTAINTKLNDEYNPKVKAIVSADQYKRLTQIQLQAVIRNQGPTALTAKDVSTELKLTDEQRKKLGDLGTEYAAKQRELFSDGGAGQEGFAKLREERTAKTMEVLTADQKKTLDTLKGKEFDVSQIGGGRGRRGAELTQRGTNAANICVAA